MAALKAMPIESTAATVSRDTSEQREVFVCRCVCFNWCCALRHCVACSVVVVCTTISTVIRVGLRNAGPAAKQLRYAFIKQRVCPSPSPSWFTLASTLEPLDPVQTLFDFVFIRT